MSGIGAPLAPWLIALVVTLAGTAIPSSVSAGTVTGKIALPKAKQSPPVRSTGFVRRKANPIMPTRQWDPRREMVVVLYGEIPAEAKTAPTNAAKYYLRGESFDVPLFPVQVGRTVQLINKGRNSPHLRSNPADIVGRRCAPLNPDVNCDLILKKPYSIVEISAQGNPHLRGRVVGIPHSLFATVDRNGKYKIENVPPGKWKVRIWYAGDWLGEAPVTVPKQRRRRPKTVKAPTYQLPNDLKSKSKSKAQAK